MSRVLIAYLKDKPVFEIAYFKGWIRETNNKLQFT